MFPILTYHGNDIIADGVVIYVIQIGNRKIWKQYYRHTIVNL